MESDLPDDDAGGTADTGVATGDEPGAEGWEPPDRLTGPETDPGYRDEPLDRAGVDGAALDEPANDGAAADEPSADETGDDQPSADETGDDQPSADETGVPEGWLDREPGRPADPDQEETGAVVGADPDLLDADLLDVDLAADPDGDPLFDLPVLDPDEIPEPAGGPPWIDPTLLGAAPAPVEEPPRSPDGALEDLAAADAGEPADRGWDVLHGVEDPAVRALARLWEPGHPEAR